jgi:predicted nucleic acid-binding protein
MILVDTGPLVALIHEDDDQHEICKETFRAITEPLGTVWPVLTEAMYLLNFSWDGQVALWEMIEAGAVEILPLGTDDVPRMRELMRKYRDLPMDLADAALVRVAERERLRRIFTLDRRDFQIYRPARLAVLPFFRPGKRLGLRNKNPFPKLGSVPRAPIIEF